jgi:hypothetical protein
MKPYLFNRGWKAFALISLSIALASCEGMGDKSPMPERKKMPRFNESAIQQDSKYFGGKGYSSCGLTTEMDLVHVGSNGDNGEYMRIPLPDGSLDEAVFNMISLYKPIAAVFLNQWAKQQGKGVIIDLRSNSRQSSTREEFKVEKKDSFSIPVVFYWDSSSAFRAKTFKDVLHSVNGISCKKIAQESFDN